MNFKQMKKLILMAAFGAAGLVSAKEASGNTEKRDNKFKEVKLSQNSRKTIQECQTVGMYVWCTGETVSDTMCWGEGAGPGCETYEKARVKQIRNSQLFTEFNCGAGTGSGPR